MIGVFRRPDERIATIRLGKETPTQFNRRDDLKGCPDRNAEKFGDATRIAFRGEGFQAIAVGDPLSQFHRLW